MDLHLHRVHFLVIFEFIIFVFCTKPCFIQLILVPTTYSKRRFDPLFIFTPGSRQSNKRKMFIKHGCVCRIVQSGVSLWRRLCLLMGALLDDDDGCVILNQNPGGATVYTD